MPVFESGEARGLLYIAMRLVEGDTLAERMAAGLTARETVTLLAPIAAALDAAHAAGLIHRDVKPQNILIGEGGRPFLADFGVSKLAGAGRVTRANGFMGQRQLRLARADPGRRGGPRE